MDKTTSSTIVIAVLLLALVGMLIGWRRRQSSQAHLAEPDAIPLKIGDSMLRVEALYLASTIADDELNRIAVSGLGFRARAVVTVSQAGIVLDLVGEREVFISRAKLRDIDRATFTIDRAVETDGLVRITWLLGDTAIDSYLRLTNASESAALIQAVESILPTSAPLKGHA